MTTKIQLLDKMVAEINQRITGAPAHFKLAPSSILPERYRFIEFFVPGIIAMAIMTSCLSNALNMNAELRQKGILRKLATTPITRADWLVASILYQLVLSVISTAAILLVSYAVFDVRLRIDAWLPLIIVVEVIAFVGIGMLLTPFAKEAESASAVANAFLFPMMFLSGTFFPVEMMPVFLQTFAKLLPLYYVNEALREAMIFVDHSATLQKRRRDCRIRRGRVRRRNVQDTLGRRDVTATKRILFICGSMNQTTQMHQISRHLTEYEQVFTPYYCDGLHEVMRRMKLLEFTIIGDKLAKRCQRYLEDQNLAIDYRGQRGPYDLVVTCSDVFLQRNIRENRIVLVQEGITDPEDRNFRLVQRHRWLPLWIAGTAGTGLSDAYRAFCVASDGYRELFIRRGAKADKIVVTGIPNFDDCQRYRDNTFPHRNFVLVCTSPLREIFRGEDRKSFILEAVKIANGRPMIFKFHPNEDLAPGGEGSESARSGRPGFQDRERGGDDRQLRRADHPILVNGVRRAGARQGNVFGLPDGRVAQAAARAEPLRSAQYRERMPASARGSGVAMTAPSGRRPVSDGITVRATTSWRDRRRFQRFPWALYAGDRNWVPPILSQERLLLGWGRHPFFANAEMITLLAERSGKVAGRVAVFVNNVHNRKYEEKRGFFGFFECVDDVAVARRAFRCRACVAHRNAA